MNILLFGGAGQVGWELQRSLAPLGCVVAMARLDSGGDLLDAGSVAGLVRSLQPRVIVNAAAYTAVDRAEAEPALAERVNAGGPALLAALARDTGALLVHYSTDYVFDGSGTRPWCETDVPAPLNVYGRTKLAGEVAIAASQAHHLILRTSWVHSARGSNFMRSILQLAHDRETLHVVDDQVGAPTGADLIADVTAHAIRSVLQDPAKGGTYHLSAAGETSWHGYAEHFLGAASRLAPERVAVKQILPVPSEAFPTAARRPHNSRLDTRKLRETFHLHLPDWRDSVVRTLQDILR